MTKPGVGLPSHSFLSLPCRLWSVPHPPLLFSSRPHPPFTQALVRRPLELDDLSNAVVGGRIRNYFNPNDRALYYISQVVNWSDRLGLTPLVAAAEAREGFENVDASSDFEISNSHGYLVDVFLDICRWSFGGDQ